MLVLGCSDRRDAAPAASQIPPPSTAAVAVVDSIELEQPDSLILADVSALAVTRDRIVLVGDNREKRLLRYGPTGRLLGQIGRRGGGPGEYESVAALALDGDSLVAVQNFGARRIELYRLADGAHVWGTRLDANLYGIAMDRGRIVGGAINASGDSSTLTVERGQTAARWIGPVPAVVKELPMLGGPFGTEAVAIKDSLIVMAFEATNRVYFLQNGRLLDRFVPIARRRGAREDLMRQAPTGPAAAQAALYKSSVPVAIGLLTDGTIALVHADVDLAGTVFKGRHFLTLMRPGRYQVCLDIPLSVPDDPMPRFTFAGDTLIAGVMHVTEATQASAFLKRFLVDADRCEWFGVSGSR